MAKAKKKFVVEVVFTVDHDPKVHMAWTKAEVRRVFERTFRGQEDISAHARVRKVDLD